METIIISFSHDKIWTQNGPIPTDHRPYFLLKDDGREIPILNDVVQISEPFEMESYVNWDDKITVRRIYITKPGVTPAVSTEYFKLGFETFEISVPYQTRVAADLEAAGNWHFDTQGQWIELNCLIYDHEYLQDKDWLACIGFGEFKIKIKSSIDWKRHKFSLEVQIPDSCNITQALSPDPAHEFQILQKMIDKFEPAHIFIGHNLAEADNWWSYERLQKYPKFNDFVRKRMYHHQGFNRGRVQKDVVETYPLTFDTLHAARFLFKDKADAGYGLKQLAKEFKLSPPDRVYEKDFGGFGNWSVDEDTEVGRKCLKYNRDDIFETFGLFKLEFNAILINMFISGLSFQDVVSGANGKLADHVSLVLGNNKQIAPPMMHPSKVALALNKHFNGALKTKKEIFEYFRVEHPECNSDCAVDEMPYYQMRDKLMRVVKYGEEMPDWITYYPICLETFCSYHNKKHALYLAVGGLTGYPQDPLTPEHDVNKCDVAAQYPTAQQAKNISFDTVKLAKKGQRVDGWCWFREWKIPELLNIFEWKYAKEFPYTDGEGVMIGYIHRGKPGLINEAQVGIIAAVGEYKILSKKNKDWEIPYQKTLKPMRNALTHGVLLALHATCQQFNLAGCAIPTTGQEISYQMLNHVREGGWKLLEADTDGAEFNKSRENPDDFQKLVTEVEEYWKEQLKYPLSFDVEYSKHKLYLAMKNYVTINEKNDVKLTGNTLHSSDKPKVAESIMKKLMIEVLPKVNTKDEFITMIRERAYDIVNEGFKNVKDDDLIIVSGINDPVLYTQAGYRERAELMEKMLNITITFKTKQEFYVCKEKLPGLEGNKTFSDPIAWMWPRTLVEAGKATRDYDWYKDMVFSYIDAAFGFKGGVSTKNAIKSISSYFDKLGESDEIKHDKKIEEPDFKMPKNQTTLFD